MTILRRLAAEKLDRKRRESPLLRNFLLVKRRLSKPFLLKSLTLLLKRDGYARGAIQVQALQILLKSFKKSRMQMPVACNALQHLIGINLSEESLIRRSLKTSLFLCQPRMFASLRCRTQKSNSHSIISSILPLRRSTAFISPWLVSVWRYSSTDLGGFRSLVRCCWAA